MSPADGSVALQLTNSIATLTFERPSARNAMTWLMYQQLASHLELLRIDRTVRMVVLRGSHGTFVAGTDIAQFTDFDSGSQGVEYERRLEAIVGDLESLPIPTLAVIEGYAVGAGLVLAAVCDLRICTADARFGMPIARTVGNCLSNANHARLAAAFGASRTKALILLADTISADVALACGFVTSILPADQLDAQVASIGQRVTANAPITMAVTKESVRRLTHARLPDGDDLLRQAYGSRDFREGVDAFLAKRPPRWRGE